MQTNGEKQDSQLLITDKIDNITRIPESHLGTKLPAPKSVKIELTARCNYRCSFCALRTRESQPKEDMSLGLFKTITKEMRDAGVEEIGLFYLGESMMAPSLLIEAIKWCKELGFPYLFLTTNGSLCTPAVMRGVFKAGLDSLKFSVNCHSEDQFEEVVGVSKKLFYQSLENIRTTVVLRNQLDAPCKIYASSIQYDGEQQKEMERVLSEYVYPYVDQHYWLPLYSMGSIATEREEELGYRPIAGNQGRIGALREPLPCWSAFTEGHVRADGGLSACCFDASGDWIMGDLTKTPFMEAWNSEPFQDLREAHLRQDVTGTICENCVAYQ